MATPLAAAAWAVHGDVVLASEESQQRIVASTVGGEAIEIHLGIAVDDRRLAGEADIGDAVGQLHATLVDIGVPLLGG